MGNLSVPPRLYQDAVQLLCRLISTPSISKEERFSAEVLTDFLMEKGIATHRHLNNVWAQNKYFNPEKPVILLNSHHDTVKPNQGYTRPPFEPAIEDGKLYGLGSNDAGASLVALTGAFLFFYERSDLPFNLMLAASAEEEISGANGISALLPLLGPVSCAIVGEPTQLQMAVAEKGLLVIDAVAKGQSGHAAREEGDNALYKALDDIQRLRHFQFDKISEWLGPVKTTVTHIQAGLQHNVIPDTCSYTIDVRVNDCYTLEAVFDQLRLLCSAELTPRSLRLCATRIDPSHPLVKAGLEMGKTMYGSPTLSDKALMPFPALKIGPGDSARSHTADEFIFLSEIEEGLNCYIKLLQNIQIT